MDRDAIYEELKAMKNRLVELAADLEEAGDCDVASKLDDAYVVLREAQTALVRREGQAAADRRVE